MEYTNPNMNTIYIRIEKLRLLQLDKFYELLESSNLLDRPYAQNRLSYIAAHFLANEYGVTAPAFRHMRKTGKHTKLNPEEKAIECDRQVIDLHYLFCQHRPSIEVRDNDYKSLLFQAAETFDLNLAIKLAKLCRSADNKCTQTIIIPDAIQYELNVLHTKYVRGRIIRCRNDIGDVQRSLFNRIQTASSRMGRDQVDEKVIDFRCLRYAHGSTKIALKYKQLITGIHIPNALLAKILTFTPINIAECSIPHIEILGQFLVQSTGIKFLCNSTANRLTFSTALLFAEATTIPDSVKSGWI